VRFAELVDTSGTVRTTRSRRTKIAALAAALRQLGADEVRIGVRLLSGRPRQDRLEVGWAALREATPPPAAHATLAVADVDAALEQLAEASGAGSRTRRHDVLVDLLGRATAAEQDFLRGLVLRELRQGALEGVMVHAVADAAGVEVAAVRRAVMVNPDLGAVAEAALEGGEAALAEVRLTVFRPLAPMLAGTAPDVASAVAELGPVVVEDKVDGARVQVHRSGEAVRVYTRNLRDVTHRVPEVVAVVADLPVDTVVLDGEVVALGPDGRPQPFQVTMGRFGSEDEAVAAAGEVPLSLRLFDLLHVDGEDLLEQPTTVRRERLHALVPADHRVRSELVGSVDAAREVLRRALDDGHEGVMVKAVEAPYEAGRRGAAWRKVKPVHTLDLVVLAAEWGSGRRRGWLSNLHLGARDADDGGVVMLGKTFKGLTDELLAWQTGALLERETHRSRQVVHVRPELVVEVAFDGVQASSRYPGGVTLRFARVKGYRPDKDPAEADTLQTVQAIHRGERRPRLA
jgi:DNA ligase-1